MKKNNSIISRENFCFILLLLYLDGFSKTNLLTLEIFLGIITTYLESSKSSVTFVV